MATAALLVVAVAVHAQVPPIINYQGQLLDASGNPANGNFTMVFSVFDVATGGAALYTETQTITVSNGLFNVLIGSVTPIPDTLFDSGPNRWLEITANGNVLTPRRRFGSVPYAFNAGGNGSSSPWQISGNNVYYNNGNVGIGAAAPGATLDIEGQLPNNPPNTPNLRLTNFGRFSLIRGRSANGTRSAPTATLNNNALLNITADGYTGSAFTGLGQATIQFIATENWTSTANGTALKFSTTPNGSTGEVNRMIIENNGFVGIGTNNPDALVHSQSSGNIPSFLAGGSSADFAVPDNYQAMQFGSWDGSSVFTEWMRIGSAGNVGIGTTNPGIFSGATKYLTLSASDFFSAGKVAALELQGSTISNFDPVARIDFSSVGSSGPNNLARIHVEAGQGLLTAGELVFFTHDGAALNERMRIDQDGNVGIGRSNPTEPLHLGSGAHVTAGGVWTNASSRTYKENIHDLSTEAALSALETLTPVEFNYKVDKDDACLGFIAEDVPALVATKDRKGLSAMDIVAMLTKVVQHQQRQIAELQTRLKTMEK